MTTDLEYRELIQRAREVGYKNKIPVLKEKNKYIQSSIRGFEQRLENWKQGLIELEKNKKLQ